MAITVNWAPATEADEVVQNVRTIVATGTGTVPLDRSFGTPQDVVDIPMSIAGARLRASVIEAVQTYEPRVAVTRVTLEGTADGSLSVGVAIGAP